MRFGSLLVVLAFLFQGCSQQEEGEQCVKDYLDIVISGNYTSAGVFIDKESSIYNNRFSKSHELAVDSTFGRLKRYSFHFSGAHYSASTVSPQSTTYTFPVMLVYDSTEIVHEFVVVDRGEGFKILMMERME